MKASLSDEISHRLLLNASGMFFIMHGDCLDLLRTWREIVVGFKFGLYFSVVRSSVTSRKLTIFLFASMAMRRLLFTNILQLFFFGGFFRFN